MDVIAFTIHLVIYSADILFTGGGGFHLVAMTTHIFLQAVYITLNRLYTFLNINMPWCNFTDI